MKSNILHQHGESNVVKLWEYSSHCGGFVFQNMPQEIFIRECSFINIIPRCWALLHYNDTGVPHSVKEISTEQQCVWGRGGQRKEEVRGVVWGQTKENLITPSHGSSTSRRREIHHLLDQTGTCAQGKAQWKLHPPIGALSSLAPFFLPSALLPRHLHPTDSHQRQRASFRHALWNRECLLVQMTSRL